MKSSVYNDGTSTRKMARVVKQVNKHPQRFAEPRPHLTISGPKKLTLENIKGGLHGCNLSFGRGVMTYFIGLSFSRRHLKQFLMIFFAKSLPPSIQNIFLVCARVCSLPAWARLSWLTVANNQPISVVLLWEYDWVLFRHRTVQLLPPAGLEHKKPPLPAPVSTSQACWNSLIPCWPWGLSVLQQNFEPGLTSWLARLLPIAPLWLMPLYSKRFSGSLVNGKSVLAKQCNVATLTTSYSEPSFCLQTGQLFAHGASELSPASEVSIVIMNLLFICSNLGSFPKT